MTVGKTHDDFIVEPEVVRKGVEGESFDLLLRFNGTIDQPELFMDDLVKTILDGLLERYGQIIVKVNWWTDGLQVIVPNGIPDPNTSYNAREGHSQARREAIDSNPNPTMDLEK